MDFIAQGDKVVVTGTSSMRILATNQRRDAHWAHVYTVRSGKIAAFEEFYDTALKVQDYQARTAGGHATATIASNR